MKFIPRKYKLMQTIGKSICNLLLVFQVVIIGMPSALYANNEESRIAKEQLTALNLQVSDLLYKTIKSPELNDIINHYITILSSNSQNNHQEELKIKIRKASRGRFNRSAILIFMCNFYNKKDLITIEEKYHQYLKNKDNTTANSNLLEMVTGISSRIKSMESGWLINDIAWDPYQSMSQYHDLFKKYYNIRSSADYVKYARKKIRRIRSTEYKLEKSASKLKDPLSFYQDKMAELIQYSKNYEAKEAKIPTAIASSGCVKSMAYEASKKEALQENCIYNLYNTKIQISEKQSKPSKNGVWLDNGKNTVFLQTNKRFSGKNNIIEDAEMYAYYLKTWKNKNGKTFQVFQEIDTNNKNFHFIFEDRHYWDLIDSLLASKNTTKSESKKASSGQ